MQPYIQGTLNFCTNLSRDFQTVVKRNSPQEKLVASVALRALGALVGTYGLYSMLAGLTGGGVAPLVFGAVWFAVGHDAIEVGKNIKPAQNLQEAAQQVMRLSIGLWKSLRLPTKAELSGTWLFDPICEFYTRASISPSNA